MSVPNPMRKRPCRICRKWFRPDPRLGERQKTCGGAECRGLWHRQKCGEWNRENRQYFQDIYLGKRLAQCDESSAPTAGDGVSARASPVPQPRSVVQEVIGLKPLVIIEYLLQQPLRRFQEVIKAQQLEIKGKTRQLPSGLSSRGDCRAGLSTVPWVP